MKSYSNKMPLKGAAIMVAMFMSAACAGDFPAAESRLAETLAKVYGGAPLLGAKGLVLKTHGNSDAGSFYNTIIQGHDFSVRGVNDQIAQAFLTLQE